MVAYPFDPRTWKAAVARPELKGILVYKVSSRSAKATYGYRLCLRNKFVFKNRIGIHTGQKSECASSPESLSQCFKNSDLWMR